MGVLRKSLLLFLLLAACSSKLNAQYLITNTSHLDHLYQEINVENRTMGIIHIYSEYLDYKWVDDADEGIACVDDVSRASVFYLKHFKLTNNRSSLHKVKALTEFLLYMQSDNGWFYNFIWNDYSINKTFVTSLAIPNWWTWRALWALTESYPVLKELDELQAKAILSAINKTIDACKREYASNVSTINIDGFTRPQRFPFQTAADQAAILSLGLTNYFKITSDDAVIPLLEKMCRGILLMQEGDDITFPYGAFLSWQNMWHAYGNLQSYALLKTYEVLKRDEYKNAALFEINNFYEYLIDQKYLNEFVLTRSHGIALLSKSEIFPQIAYGIRPMIYASITAYEIEGDKKYLEKALRIAAWFLGKNYPQSKMYDPITGRCFDGITSISDINMNSGAESTIEALLSLVELEKYPGSTEYLNKIMNLHTE